MGWRKEDFEKTTVQILEEPPPLSPTERLKILWKGGDDLLEIVPERDRKTLEEINQQIGTGLLGLHVLLTAYMNDLLQPPLDTLARIIIQTARSSGFSRECEERMRKMFFNDIGIEEIRDFFIGCAEKKR